MKPKSAGKGEIVVLGLGHIGASLAARLRARGYRVLGWDRSAVAVKFCRSRRWIDDAFKGKAAPRASVTCVVAVPERAVRDKALVRMLAALPEGALVTDVFSSKGMGTRVLSEACEGLGLAHAWSHPLAGREGQGAESADPAIFDGAVTLVDRAAAPEARKRLETLWKNVGTRVELVSTDEHQRRMAAGSHLMHVVAYAVSAAVAKEAAPSPSVLGVTRVARSSPEAWTDILLSNREALGPAVEELQRQLETVRGLLMAREEKALLRFLRDAQAARLKLDPKLEKP